MINVRYYTEYHSFTITIVVVGRLRVNDFRFLGCVLWITRAREDIVYRKINGVVQTFFQIQDVVKMVNNFQCFFYLEKDVKRL
jgi:hypothetical protein